MTRSLSIPYFPRALKMCVPVIFGGSVYVAILGHPIWALFLILLGVIIHTTKYVTRIDLTEKVIHDYLSFLFISIDKESRKFTGVDRIVITKGSYAQTLNTRAQPRQLEWNDYTGTLVFENGETLNLLTRNSKKDLIAGLKEFYDYLNVGVEDQSTTRKYWVYMDGVFE